MVREGNRVNRYVRQKFKRRNSCHTTRREEK
jgi:hypothetical protein